MSSDYDAIIIGSGLGGLSCGTYLALKGQKVLILEKHISAGGYAASYQRGPYKFARAHMIGGVGKDQYMAKFFDLCGVAERIEFLKIKVIRAVFPNHDIRFPSGDLEGVIAVLEENFPDEKEGIRNLFNEMVKVYKDVIKFFYSTAPMWQQLPIFPFRYKSLFSVMKKTVKELLNKHLKNEKLKALVFANWGYYGLPPSKLNVLGVAAHIDYSMEGGYYPKGGNQVVPDAFMKVLRQNYGEILFGSEVSTIIVKNGKAIGVVTKNGEKYLGKNIISNADPLATFHSFIGKEKLPAKFLAKMDRMEPSVSGFNVNLGLDEDFKATLDNSDDFDIVVSNTYDQDEDFQRSLNCEVEEASFFITLFSNVDASLAKGNRFVMSLLQKQSYDYWKKFEAAYAAGHKDEYNKEKDRMAGILIKRAEKVIPNMSKHIEAIEVETPLTMKKYTNNLNGALYGWTNTIKQFTPMDRTPKIPVKNLYLSSAWAFPGEGQATTVACGYRLGRQLVG